MTAPLFLAFVRERLDAMFAWRFIRFRSSTLELVDLPLNDVSQLSDMYRIVENVRCFHHVDSGRVILLESVLSRRRPVLSAGYKRPGSGRVTAVPATWNFEYRKECGRMNVRKSAN